MGDISKYIDEINLASRGDEVRTSIVNALNALNNGADNAAKLDGHPANYYITVEQFNEYTKFDEVPTQDSTKGVRSGGLYNFLETTTSLLNLINGGA